MWKYKNEYIKYAAIKRSDGEIVTGKNHSECIKKSPFGTCKAGSESGFVTSKRRFVNRYEASRIAVRAKQIRYRIKDYLFSEDLYDDLRGGNCYYGYDSGFHIIS